MGLLILGCVAIVYSRWRAGAASGRQCLAVILLGLASFALAEVKFALLLLPIAALLLQGKSLIRRPLTAIPAVSAVLAVSAGIALLYGSQYGDTRLPIEQQMEQWVEVNTDPNQFERRTNEIGRVAAIEQWIAMMPVSSATEILLGHGAGESRLGSIVSGDLAQRMGFALDRNSLSLLLWETGALGTAAFVLTIVLGLLCTARLSSRCRDPLIRADMKAAGVILFLLLLTLPYTSDLATTSQIQLLYAMFLGAAAAHVQQLTSGRNMA